MTHTACVTRTGAPRPMRARFDPLIAERAGWLFGDRPWVPPARTLLMGLLGYERTIALAETFRDTPSGQIMRTMGRLLASRTRVRGLSHIPRHGPALIVANHPTGIADGIMLSHALRGIRDDLFFYANADILRVMPQMEDMIVPVEWRTGDRSYAKTRVTMERTRRALDAGKLGVIFPSGRLAKRRGLTLCERPWMASAALIARKFDLPVVPVHLRARNSALFYMFDLLHPSLRDITLFHETLNKARQPFRITFGEPISGATLPTRPEDGIAVLRRATLALGDMAVADAVQASRRPQGRGA